MQKKTFLLLLAGTAAFSLIQFSCSSGGGSSSDKPKFGGFESQVKWGEYVVTTSGCTDCHTPKKMTNMGPVDDSTLWLSGHPSAMPLPDIDRKMLESKGLAASNTLTQWLGPWGVSFTANLTPDATGLGAWTEDQFIFCIRNGVSKGIKGNRPLLPPMPWPSYRLKSDDELKAIFAYLKSIKPIHNVVPQPLHPASMDQGNPQQ